MNCLINYVIGQPHIKSHSFPHRFRQRKDKIAFIMVNFTTFSFTPIIIYAHSSFSQTCFCIKIFISRVLADNTVNSGFWVNLQNKRSVPLCLQGGTQNVLSERVLELLLLSQFSLDQSSHLNSKNSSFPFNLGSVSFLNTLLHLKNR